MRRIHLDDAEGTVFPAGRRTKVLVGKDSPLQAKGFAMGRVRVFPGGSIPAHEHVNEEIYHILSGTGEMQVGNETERVRAGDTVYMEPDVPHTLRNTGDSDMELLFVYSPAGVVEHWREELEGKRPQG